MPDLRARAGVVTGQVAALANPGEGLVVGDRVNTASRVQSAAEPGTVLVDDVTHEVTSAAIAYEDAGEHAVKGKARAAAPVAGACGSSPASAGPSASVGIEAPFVGRDADLRLLKELFHGALERRAARLVAVSGDGRGRQDAAACGSSTSTPTGWRRLSCGIPGAASPTATASPTGRWRRWSASGFGIAEEASAQEHSRQAPGRGSTAGSPTPADREFLAPRLGALLGVAEPGLGRAELFAGWRLFLERLAEHLPVVLVFEDLQWADEGLLDFIEHLLEWSAASPIFMLTLARPELAARARRRGRRAARRDAAAARAARLRRDGQAARRACRGAARGERAERIIDRAEGVPLYAIETIRALANRGVLERARRAPDADRGARRARRPGQPRLAAGRAPGRAGAGSSAAS